MEKMSDAANGDEIEIYLKDHYAGGIGALELIEHSIETHDGHAVGRVFRGSCTDDIKADHDQLHNLMTALGVADSDARNAGAWLAEKFSRAKLGFSGGEFRPAPASDPGESHSWNHWKAVALARPARDPAVVASPAADGLRVSGAARHRTVEPGRNQTARNGAFRFVKE